METEIQFDEVQRPAGASSCASCRSALLKSYYQANGVILCERCAAGFEKHFHGKEGGPVRFLKAVVFGIGGGLAGAAVYTAVLALAHLNVALITILIGWLVGKMVRKGSGGRGGLIYQILAVLLTYAMIGASLMLSDILTSEGDGGDLLRNSLLLIIGAVTGPVINATHSLLGGLITIFGLVQAWRLNTPAQVHITGPHALNPAGSAPLGAFPEQTPSQVAAIPSTIPLPPPSA